MYSQSGYSCLQPIFTLFSQKKRIGESMKTLMFYNCSTCFASFTFTGKEKDSETGYYYFGARYYDCDLSGLFLSVDPMSDKYPSLSPYAYCAWNPVKLVDPDGDSITFDFLNDEAHNQKLLKSLSDISGLSLFLENGTLKYEKNTDGTPKKTKGSESARNDLLECIDNSYIITVQIGKYGKMVDRGKSQSKNDLGLSNIQLDIMDFSDLDNPTFDIGMVFMHEYQHAFFGLEDDGKPTVFNLGANYGEYSNGTVGSVVEKVNKYRLELGLPIRDSYESNPYEGIYYEKIPFVSKKGEKIWL